LYGRPHCDIFLQNKFLIPGIDLRIQFERATDEFCLYGPANDTGQKFKLELDEVVLYLVKHTVLPSIAVNQLQRWESGSPVCYPMKKVEIKTFSIATGCMQVVNENLLTGQVPDRIILGLLNSQDIHGNQQSNPFVFKDYNLTYINVSIDGDQISGRPLDLSFGDKSPKFMRAYYNIFETLGYSDCDVGLDLDIDEFKNGKQLYAFQLRPLTENFTTPRYGNVKIELKWNPGTTHPLTVLVYAEYQSILHIDNMKTVYFKDYSSPG
jgi:hypothetical protein